MNKTANVIFPYDAKNDDELDLIVGQQIEIIGVEEEGWWKGKSNGKIGLFPSNFVQIIEQTNPSTPDNKNNNTRKLANIFGNKANKNSPSFRNSLNSNNNNTNINLMESNQQASSTVMASNDDSPSITISEIKPKPVKGIGYGDIFAVGLTKLKPLPADNVTTSVTTATSVSTSVGSSASASVTKERLNASGGIVSNSLQKQIPKKPPPPAPISDSNQAPALPPKPFNHFSPVIQQQQLFKSSTQQKQASIAQQVRERARVIYVYEPLNEDELALEVGDIIYIIDKEIEDAGWWKGELNGKIGVFPENFVEIIQADESTTSKLIDNNIVTKPIIESIGNNFGKGLKNNLLDKQAHNIGNNTTGTSLLLSAKRSKFQHLTKSLDYCVGMANDTESPISLQPETNPSSNKLKHITINRARGPSRKPPSDVSRIKNQTVFNAELLSNDDSVDSNQSTDINNTLTDEIPIKTTFKNDAIEESSRITKSLNTNLSLQSIKSETSTKTNQPYIKSSSSMDNVLENQPILSRTNPRVVAQPTLPIERQTKVPASTTTSLTTTPTTPTTPSWMQELKKAQAEKKRDSPSVVSSSSSTLDKTNTTLPPVQSQVPVVKYMETDKKDVPEQGQVKSSNNLINNNNNNNNEQCDKLLEEMSKNFKDELNELRSEIKALKLEFAGMSELKNVLEVMKNDVKVCQSAIDNQKKYMKDLVNSLADERKQILLLQEELDRNLK